MAKPRVYCVKGAGIFLIVVGLFVLIVGIIVTPKEFPKYFSKKLNDYLVIDSDAAEQYDSWAGQDDVDNPYYLEVYMYNLTNVPQVIERTATPLYTIVGPYVYRRFRNSINVSFPDNGNKIQYAESIDYIFDSNASGSLSDSDMIVNINPVYIGALMQLNVNEDPSEQNLLIALTGALIKTYTDYFTGSFLSLFIAFDFPNKFTKTMENTISEINTFNDTQQAYNMFIDTWRNSTTAPSVGDWTGILLSNTTPSGISFTSASNLLNASVAYSLLDTTPEAIWYWDQSMTNYSILVTLSEIFKITTGQVKLLWKWRNEIFGPTIMYPQIIASYSLDQFSDIGWVQWATATPLNGSIADIFPDLAAIGYYTRIELATDLSTWRQWRIAMSNTTGLENITNYQDLFKVFIEKGANGDYSQWGLTGEMAQIFVFHYVIPLIKPQIVPTISAKAGPTGGLFTSRTVSEWTFNCKDYILDLLSENPPMCAFRANNSVSLFNTIYSGKSNLEQINTYAEWQGQTSVDVWAESIPVVGHSQLGQFAPRHSSRSPIAVFQDDLVRTVYLNFTANVTVQGIPADRYVLDFNKTFGENSLYYQPFVGLANMTTLHNGSPIFLSLWSMFNVPNASNMVIGLNSTNELDASTIIDIEPTTGITIQSRKRMQVNLYVPPDNNNWFAPSAFGNDNFTTGIVYPLAQLGEYGTIDISQAANLQEKLRMTPRVKHISFYVGITLGPVLIVLGFCFIFMARRKEREEEEEYLIQ